MASKDDMNWCSRFNRKIDYELVHNLHPDCIDRSQGCAKCEFAIPRKTINFNQHGLKLSTQELDVILLKKAIIQKLDEVASAYGQSREETIEKLIEYHHLDLKKREEATHQ